MAAHNFDTYARVKKGEDFCKHGHYLHVHTIADVLRYFNTYVSQRGNRMCNICYNALGRRELYTDTLCYLDEREWRTKQVDVQKRFRDE